jgi:hypothetical protein
MIINILKQHNNNNKKKNILIIPPKAIKLESQFTNKSDLIFLYLGLENLCPISHKQF